MTIRNVLVVDDSKSARYMLRKMLAKSNLSADLAESGEEALNYLQSNRPDAIFMDHMMPGMNGLETVREIKENPSTAPIPVVMYTSQSGDEYYKNVMAHGVIDILAKPATTEDLGKILHKLNDLPANVQHISNDLFQAQNDDSIVSLDAIERKVRQVAESAVSTAVKVQVIQTMAEQLSNFRKEIAVRDETIASDVANRTFDIRLNGLTNKINQQILERFEELQSQQPKGPSIEGEALEELKGIARITAASKAHDEASKIAQQVAKETAVKVLADVNRANERAAKRMTQLTFIASAVGVVSAFAVYLLLS